MFVKISKYISNDEAVSVYSYEICDASGNVSAKPTTDFLNEVYKISKTDAQILKSQLIDMTKYGLLGRKEAASGREGLRAIPDKYRNGKIKCRYRLFFWVFNGSTVIVGGGCHKPELDSNGDPIDSYQIVADCEYAANELCAIGNCIEKQKKAGKAFIEEGLIELDEVIIKI